MLALGFMQEISDLHDRPIKSMVYIQRSHHGYS